MTNKKQAWGIIALFITFDSIIIVSTKTMSSTDSTVLVTITVVLNIIGALAINELLKDKKP